MANLKLVSSKTQTEVAKFYEWLERNKNIYLADMQQMDKAFNIVRDNQECLKRPVNKGLKEL